MTYTEYNDVRGNFIEEWRNEEGILHREDGPCYIRRSNSKVIQYESYRMFKNNTGELIHRIDGPARIWYDHDGLVTEEEFWISNELLGCNKNGFYVFWDRLSEEERQNHNILKLLLKYTFS